MVTRTTMDVAGEHFSAFFTSALTTVRGLRLTKLKSDDPV
jgi:hypothetical protein